MGNDLFKLISTYELVLTLNDAERPVRIEVFSSASNNQIYRARVWVQNTYNLYPTFLNIGEHGEDLHKMHSSDQLDTDITTIIAEDPDLITGKRYGNEQAFLDYLKTRVMYYQDLVSNKD
jgi:hypothetical protein